MNLHQGVSISRSRHQPMNIHQRVSMLRSQRQAGFTLLEMLVAIAIFAGLSLGAYQVLQGVLTSDEVAKRKEARLSELQLAFSVLERDITQMVPRSYRIDGENNKVLLAASRFGQQSDDWGMAFMRGGWLNPDGMLPRSGLQRVGWRLKDHKLERLSYLYPDPVIGTEPRIQPMLERVTALRLYFYDKGTWKEVDPAQRAALRAGSGAGSGRLRHHPPPVPDRRRRPASGQWQLSAVEADPHHTGPPGAWLCWWCYSSCR